MTAFPQPSRPAEGEAAGRDTPPYLPDPRPDQWVLWGRLRLALSLLSHRPWCDQCAPHARQVEQALNGASVDQMIEGA